MSTVEPETGSTPGSQNVVENAHGSAVRFETQCVVIPDHAHHSRRPRVVTKSYALPLWKRRASPASPSASALSEDAIVGENQSHLVLRVPVPTLSLKPRSTARSIDDTPLPPCLVHRSQPSGPSCPSSSSLTRHARTPRKPSLSPSRSDILTVPLRPCCAACQSVTEAALAGGDAWPEHFSRAASRRRSVSADSGPRTITVAGSAASASYGDLGVSISVDEIDKRRRSGDAGPLTTSSELSDGARTKGECRMPLILRRTSASNSSVPDAYSPPSPTRTTPATPRIPEEEDDEDENELFPLPSPKRTPTASPTPSPAGSLSSLTVAHANQSTATSPTHSTCSGDSTSPRPSKPHFLAPPPCSSSSSLSLPKLTESTTDLALVEDPPRAPSPHLLSTLPSISGRPHSRLPSPRVALIPATPTGMLPSAADSALCRSHEPVPEPTRVTIPSSPSSSQLSTSPRHSSTHIRLPWRSKRSVSADLSPSLSSPSLSLSPSPSTSTSPALSTSPNTKRSFSVSSPRHIIADMLRGVGAMGSSGVGPGI